MFLRVMWHTYAFVVISEENMKNPAEYLGRVLKPYPSESEISEVKYKCSCVMPIKAEGTEWKSEKGTADPKCTKCKGSGIETIKTDIPRIESYLIPEKFRKLEKKGFFSVDANESAGCYLKIKEVLQHKRNPAFIADVLITEKKMFLNVEEALEEQNEEDFVVFVRIE